MQGKGNVTMKVFLLPILAASLIVASVGAQAAIFISSVSILPAQEYTRLTLESEQPIRHKLLTAKNSDQLVIDLENVEINDLLNNLTHLIGNNNPYIKSVRVSGLKTGVVRLVFDLKIEVRPQLSSLKPDAQHGYRMVLHVYPAAESAHAPASPPEMLAERCVKDWAAAWSAGNVHDYLAAYVPDFEPEGMSHEEWKKQRIDRISKSKAIDVTVDIKFSVQNGNHATVSFTQGYRSDGYHDKVEKTLQMVKPFDRWLIAEESAKAVKTDAEIKAVNQAKLKEEAKAKAEEEARTAKQAKAETKIAQAEIETETKAVEPVKLAAETKTQFKAEAEAKIVEAMIEAEEKMAGPAEPKAAAVEQGNAHAPAKPDAAQGKGKGMPRGDADAVKRIRLAAEQGDAKAQLSLGLMYEQGKGVARDYDEAVKWYRLSAEMPRKPIVKN